MLGLNVGLWLEGLLSCEHIVQDAPNSPSVDLHAVVEPLSRFRGTPFFQTGTSFNTVRVCAVRTLIRFAYLLGYVEVDNFKTDLPFARYC